jgi:hypothetical protein
MCSPVNAPSAQTRVSGPIGLGTTACLERAVARLCARALPPRLPARAEASLRNPLFGRATPSGSCCGGCVRQAVNGVVAGCSRGTGAYARQAAGRRPLDQAGRSVGGPRPRAASRTPRSVAGNASGSPSARMAMTSTVQPGAWQCAQLGGPSVRAEPRSISPAASVAASVVMLRRRDVGKQARPGPSVPAPRWEGRGASTSAQGLRPDHRRRQQAARCGCGPPSSTLAGRAPLGGQTRRRTFAAPGARILVNERFELAVAAQEPSTAIGSAPRSSIHRTG